MIGEYKEQMQKLLLKLFQFDSADLDFGIYRIMNYKRAEIERFINEDLIGAVDAAFEDYSTVAKGEVLKELEESKRNIKATLGEDAIGPSGEIKDEFRNLPIAKEYNKRIGMLAVAAVSDRHKAEIFTHIYQFFSRYYHEGDFLSLRRYSTESKYAIPYNGEEVLLYWANNDQYFIKTGEYFQNYSFKAGKYNVNFRISQAEIDTGNVKSDNRYFFLKSGEGNIVLDGEELTIFFEYRGPTEEEEKRFKGGNFQQNITNAVKDEILSGISDDNLKRALGKTKDEKSLLEKHLFSYTKKNTTDYFIHKDLKGFLERELDFYIKNEVFNLDDLGSETEPNVEKYMTRVKVIKEISKKIIEFLAQIEDFQKKLWEKKKLVLRTDFCMTLDRVPEDFYEEIVENEKQIQEWKWLFKLEEIEKESLESTAKDGFKIDPDYLKSNHYLVLDTKFFGQDFKDRLLATFEDFDRETGGLLIKSENWQGLNLLKEKYREKVKCCYIDPPFNTGSDGFVYKDNYQHSSWLSMMENRYSISREFLHAAGVIYTSIDDIEASNLKQLKAQVFGDTNFVSNVVWKKKAGGGSDAKYYAADHEYMVLFAKDESKQARYYVPLTEDLKSDYEYQDDNYEKLGLYKRKNLHQTGIDTDRPNLVYPIKCPDGTEIRPPTIWRWEEKRFLKAKEEGKIDFEKNARGEWQVLTKMYLYDEEGEEYKIKPRSILLNIALTREGNSELKELFGISPFTYPKPSKLIKYIVNINCEKEDIIMDYFSGSASTAHGVIDLNREDGGNRKYLLIEMAGYFETVMIPRIKKLIYSKDWKDGKPTSKDGTSHMFKYQCLEQYEDALNNIEFVEKGTFQKTLSAMDDYFLKYMLDFETRESPARLNVDKLSRPFEYKLKITNRESEMEEVTVDLVETFNYLLGLHVMKIRAFENNGTYYRAVYGKKGEENIAVVWRNTDELDLKADKDFIEGTVLKDFEADTVYVNGDSYLGKARPIEPVFKNLMGG